MDRKFDSHMTVIFIYIGDGELAKLSAVWYMANWSTTAVITGKHT